MQCTRPTRTNNLDAEFPALPFPFPAIIRKQQAVAAVTVTAARAPIRQTRQSASFEAYFRRPRLVSYLKYI